MSNFKILVEKTEKNNIDNFLSPDKKTIDYVKVLNNINISENIQTVINKYYRYNDYKYFKRKIIENLHFFIISISDYTNLNSFNLEKFIIEHIDNNHCYDLDFVYNCDSDNNIYNDYLIDIYTELYIDLSDNNINPDKSKNYIIDNKDKIDFITDKILFKISHIVIKNIFSNSYNLSDDENNFSSEIFFLKFISVNKDKKNNDYKKSKGKESNKKINKLSDIEIREYQNKLNDMNISDMAYEIKKNWTNINYAAAPYINAMITLNNINDNYGLDSGKSIVLYALSNMASFKGDKAKIIKQRLKKMCK